MAEAYCAPLAHVCLSVEHKSAPMPLTMESSPEIIARTRARLLKYTGRYPAICRTAGLSYSWLTKFARGARGRRPSFDLICRLQGALDELEQGSVDEKPADKRENP